MRCPLFDDGRRESPAMGFFTVFAEDLFEFFGRGFRQEFRGRRAFSSVKTQVERSLGVKAETALAVGELIGRQPEIDQNAIHRGEVFRLQKTGQIDIATAMQRDMIRRQNQTSALEHRGIAIDPDEPPGGTDLFNDFPAVTATADGAVDDD